MSCRVCALVMFGNVAVSVVMRRRRSRSAVRDWFCCVAGVKPAAFLGCVFGFAGWPGSLINYI